MDWRVTLSRVNLKASLRFVERAVTLSGSGSILYILILKMRSVADAVLAHRCAAHMESLARLALDRWEAHQHIGCHHRRISVCQNTVFLFRYKRSLCRNLRRAAFLGIDSVFAHIADSLTFVGGAIWFL